MSPDAEVLGKQRPQRITLGRQGCRPARRTGNEHDVSAAFPADRDKLADLKKRDRADAAINHDWLMLRVGTEEYVTHPTLPLKRVKPGRGVLLHELVELTVLVVRTGV